MKGKIFKNNQEWFILQPLIVEMGTRINTEIKINPNQYFWLKIWANDGDEFNYEIDVDGYAILKSDRTIENFPQD